VAAKVGYCGLDRRRAPLQGDEIRACWEAGSLPEAATLPVMPLFGQPVAQTGKLDFVEVDADGAAGAPVATATAAVEPAEVEPLFEVTPPNAATGEPRWSLWADLEA
jgi:hypothetical protein